ncbi:MAG: TetR family transcriptional regulator [Myxococcota bacterium]
MARPKNADPEETQRRILVSAIEHFGRHGLKATSLRTVAADAGVTFASVHHYFGAKTDLFERCLQTSYDRLRGLQPAILAALTDVDEPADKVRCVVRAAFDYASENQTSARFLLRVTLFDEVDNPLRLEAQTEYLDAASTLLSPLVGRPADELRVPLQGLVFLLSRAAVMTSRDLDSIAGRSGNDARLGMREYVADVAVHTLLPRSRKDD